MTNPTTPVRNKDAAATAADRAKEMASSAADKAKETDSSAVEKAKDIATSATEKARDGASAVVQTVQDAATTVGRKAEGATSAVGSRMQSLAGNIRENLPREGLLGSASSAVAESLESSGRYLQQEGLKGIAGDLGNLVRRNPIPALLVGIGLGYLIARSTRS